MSERDTGARPRPDGESGQPGGQPGGESGQPGRQPGRESGQPGRQPGGESGQPGRQPGGSARRGAALALSLAALALAGPVGAAGARAAEPGHAQRPTSRVARYEALAKQGATGRERLLAVGEDVARSDADRGAALRALASDPPAQGALLAVRRIALEAPPAVAATAAGTLLRWGHQDEALAALGAAQMKGAPVRIPLRTAFARGRFAYAPGAQALFEKGLASKHVAVRLDSAAGLLELGVRQREAHAVLRAVALEGARFDDRVAALLTLAALPADTDVLATLRAAAADPDDRVARTARHLVARAAPKQP